MEPQTTTPRTFTNFNAPVRPAPPPPVTSAPPPIAPPPPPVPPHNADNHGRLKVLLGILLAILVLVGGYMWAKKFLNSPVAEEVNEPVNSTSQEVEDNVVVEAYTESGQAPEGLPAEIPIEKAGIKESYKTAYTDQNVVQHTVTYETDRAKDVRWEEYSAFMEAAGYSMVKASTDKAKGTLYGTKDNTGLLITISRENNKTVVRINYYVRS